jgi:hypothetical protein
MSIPVEITWCALWKGLRHKRGEPWRACGGGPEHARQKDEHGKRESWAAFEQGCHYHRTFAPVSTCLSAIFSFSFGYLE